MKFYLNKKKLVFKFFINYSSKTQNMGKDN